MAYDTVFSAKYAVVIIIIIYLFQATRPIVKKRQEKQSETDRTQKHTQKQKEHNYTRDTVRVISVQ